jgi:8-oxo-dGTP pyrophosphatase MutT (NUDIX family)
MVERMHTERKEDLFYLGLKAVIRDQKNDILLLYKNKDQMRFSDTPYWDLPGGRKNRNETEGDGLRREVFEETGKHIISIGETIAVGISHLRDKKDVHENGLVLFAFLCEIDLSTPVTLSEEHTKAAWFSPHDAAHLLADIYPQEVIAAIEKLKN